LELPWAAADTEVVSRPTPPVLTIRHDGSHRTFAPGHDVIIGRDLRADIRITDPRISRAHLILRFDQGRWQAIDNGSVNGTYVNGYRMPVIDIHDGQSINIGNAGGPRLTFELGQQPERVGRPPGMGSPHNAEPSTIAWQTPPEPVQPHSRPVRQSGSLSQSAPHPAPPPAMQHHPNYPAPHPHNAPPR
jgi:ABC transport system ATP-binding/permease protein